MLAVFGYGAQGKAFSANHVVLFADYIMFPFKPFYVTAVRMLPICSDC